MRKNFKFAMAALLLLASVSANAQFGIRAGYVNSTTKFKAEGISLSPKGQSGIFAGVNYDIALVGGLSLRPGVTYTYIGGESAFSNMLSIIDDEDLPNVKLNSVEHTVSVPVDLKWAYNISDDFKMYVLAGPRAAVGISSRVSAKIDGASACVDLYSGKQKYTEGGASVTEKMEDGGPYSRFELLVGAGIGICYKKVSLELGYDWGMLNKMKSSYVEDNESIKKNQLSIGLGFAF